MEKNSARDNNNSLNNNGNQAPISNSQRQELPAVLGNNHLTSENSSRHAEVGSALDGGQMFSDRLAGSPEVINPGTATNQDRQVARAENLEHQSEIRIIERNLQSHIDSLSENEIKVGRGVANNSMHFIIRSVIVLFVFYLYFELRLRKDIIFVTFGILSVVGFMNCLYTHRKSDLIEAIIFKFIEATTFFIIIVRRKN